MVIAPKAGFATSNFLAFRNIIPTIWLMINGMQQKALIQQEIRQQQQQLQQRIDEGDTSAYFYGEEK